MAGVRVGDVLRSIHRFAGGAGGADQDDAQLLERFAVRQDHEAFAALVRRHGPLVWRICLRILGDAHDAEDAFQTTFLALARQAGSIRKPGSLSSWLHGTACRIARKARAARASRDAGEHPGPVAAVSDPALEAACREVARVVEEEVGGLAEKYRAVLLLCYWDGATTEEAARRLGCPLGTVKTRLIKARQLLHDRLVRRGVTLPAGVLSTLLAAAPGRSPVPPALAAATARVAAALVEGGSKSMALTKLKIGVLALAATLLSAGVGLVACHALAVKESQPAGETRPTNGVEAGRVPTDFAGDPLPAGALARLGTARFRHGQMVNALAYSPDGKMLASVSWDLVVHLWEADTGREIRQVRHDKHAYSVCFSPDSKTFATGGASVRLWDVATGKELFCRKSPGVYALAFSPDGKLLASGAGDRIIRLWEVATGKELRQFVGHGEHVTAVAFSPDGKLLASKSMLADPFDAGFGERIVHDRTIRLWDVRTGKEVRQFSGHGRGTHSLAYSPDGQLLASAGGDKVVRLWEVATGKEVRRLEGHVGAVHTVAFSPDGKVVASGGWDRTIRLWSVATGKEINRWAGHALSVHAVAFSPDGRTLASTGDGHTIRLWDVRTGKPRLPERGHRDLVTSLAFAPDGRTLASIGRDNTVRLWEVGTGRELRSFQGRLRDPGFLAFNGGRESVAFSPDGKVVASASVDTGTVLREVSTEKELCQVRETGSALLSPDGKVIASSEALWDARTGKLLRRLEWPKPREHAGTSFSGTLYCDGMRTMPLALSPDGKTLAASHVGGDLMGAILLFDVASGKERRRFKHEARVTGLAFSPDGEILAASGRDGMVRLWRMATSEEVRRIAGPKATVLSLVFSPDSRTLALARENTVELWEVATWKKRREFRGHHGVIRALAYSPDGKLLASGGLDTTVLLWDVLSFATGGIAIEAERLWRELASADAAGAYPAMCRLARSPGPAVSLFKTRLRPASAEVSERIRRLLADLDSDRFAEREAASKELEKLGRAVEPALRVALRAKPSLEARVRMEQLLGKIGTPPEAVRELRAVEVLEHIGTADARQVLQTLARGASEAGLTQAARAALARLARRPQDVP